MKEPAIKKAVTTLEFLSQDEEARRLYEERQRALHDYVSDMEGAKEEGLQEGVKKVAKQMLEDQVPVATISKYTGLSVGDIEKLRRETQ